MADTLRAAARRHLAVMHHQRADQVLRIIMAQVFALQRPVREVVAWRQTTHQLISIMHGSKILIVLPAAAVGAMGIVLLAHLGQIQTRALAIPIREALGQTQVHRLVTLRLVAHVVADSQVAAASAAVIVVEADTEDDKNIRSSFYSINFS